MNFDNLPGKFGELKGMCGLGAHGTAKGGQRILLEQYHICGADREQI